MVLFWCIHPTIQMYVVVDDTSIPFVCISSSENCMLNVHVFSTDSFNVCSFLKTDDRIFFLQKTLNKRAVRCAYDVRIHSESLIQYFVFPFSTEKLWRLQMLRSTVQLRWFHLILNFILIKIHHIWPSFDRICHLPGSFSIFKFYFEEFSFPFTCIF